MANIRSAEKSIRKTIKRTAANNSVRSRMRTLRKKVVVAIEAGDEANASDAYRQYVSALDRAAKNNVIHDNAAARQKSRLSIKLAGLKKA